MKTNLDIDAIFHDRDSRKIFGFYNDLDNDLSDMEDDPYIDDNDYRRSSLNLSTPLQTEQMTVDTEKRPRTDDDEFIKPTRTGQRSKVSEKERHPSISSQSSNDGKSQTQKSKPQQNKPTETQRHPVYQSNRRDEIPDLQQNWNHDRITTNLPKTTNPPTLMPIKPEQVGLNLYRSNLDKKYLTYALTTSDNSARFKFTVAPSEKLSMIHNLLIEGLITVNSRHILDLPHEDFIKLVETTQIFSSWTAKAKIN